jgi:hypothetical protein
VNEFVEECRREWKRLRVPDAVANEMAADLAADLDEAEADGVSAEAVLGSGAFDPRSFAAAWAAERGVIEPEPAAAPPPVSPAPRGRTLLVPLLFAAIALFGAVLVIDPPQPRVTRVAVVSSTARPAFPIPAPPSAFRGRPLQVGPRALTLGDASGFDARVLGLPFVLVGLGGLAGWWFYHRRFPSRESSRTRR